MEMKIKKDPSGKVQIILDNLTHNEISEISQFVYSKLQNSNENNIKNSSENNEENIKYPTTDEFLQILNRNPELSNLKFKEVLIRLKLPPLRLGNVRARVYNAYMKARRKHKIDDKLIKQLTTYTIKQFDIPKS